MYSSNPILTGPYSSILIDSGKPSQISDLEIKPLFDLCIEKIACLCQIIEGYLLMTRILLLLGQSQKLIELSTYRLQAVFQRIFFMINKLHKF